MEERGWGRVGDGLGRGLGRGLGKGWGRVGEGEGLAFYSSKLGFLEKPHYLLAFPRDKAEPSRKRPPPPPFQKVRRKFDSEQMSWSFLKYGRPILFTPRSGGHLVF